MLSHQQHFVGLTCVEKLHMMMFEGLFQAFAGAIRASHKNFQAARTRNRVLLHAVFTELVSCDAPNGYMTISTSQRPLVVITDCTCCPWTSTILRCDGWGTICMFVLAADGKGIHVCHCDRWETLHWALATCRLSTVVSQIVCRSLS